MKKILFPTDFSNTANAAFLYALKFAAIFEAEIIVLHVYDFPTIDAPVMPEATKDIFDGVTENQRKNFDAELKKLGHTAEKRNMSGIKLHNMLEHGDLTYNIKKICADEEVDLIVMGTTGASGVAEIFLGSNAATIIENTQIPVLGIPTAAANHHQIKNIVFTTQYKEEDVATFENLLKIAEKINAKIYCLHVHNDDDPEDVGIKATEWKMKYKNNDVSFFTISGSHVEQTILDFIENQQVDMVVMLKQKRNFFERLFHSSLTKKMAYHTKIPILIFKS
ncbi:universal stress protein [Flavobacterium litorale]|uniref:Universal stress protein n=1 Tax=Flavobacterium litorale TaxID=2856519 RepID=A0ABX8V7B7_9FLAO|nr:universal stress protein [Flavobacterium litorale]QYJ68018.1 universal stress protein [Flavobacterium litorale]